MRHFFDQIRLAVLRQVHLVDPAVGRGIALICDLPLHGNRVAGGDEARAGDLGNAQVWPGDKGRVDGSGLIVAFKFALIDGVVRVGLDHPVPSAFGHPIRYLEVDGAAGAGVSSQAGGDPVVGHFVERTVGVLQVQAITPRGNRIGLSDVAAQVGHAGSLTRNDLVGPNDVAHPQI